MAYVLRAVTIRTNNTAEGMEKMKELWRDIAAGTLPILFDSTHQIQQGILPVATYCNYESDESGAFDLRIAGVTSAFFEEMEKATASGRYKRYDVVEDDPDLCAKRAWEMVWREQKAGIIRRVFSEDYESTVPAFYAEDGKMHCSLYIAVR